MTSQLEAKSRLVKIKDAQIKNYEQILANQSEVELNLEGTIRDQKNVISSQQKKIKLFKGAFLVSLGMLPAALVVGAIYSPL